MARWRRIEGENSSLRHANEDAHKKGEKEKGAGGGAGGQPY